MRLLFLIIALLLIPSVFAVGITPASQSVTYEQGTVYEGRIKVVGDGEIFLSSSDPRLEFESNYIEGDTVVPFTVSMRDFEPGPTTIHITASQVSEGGMISSQVAVSATVTIERPVQGKYATFQVFPPKEGANSFYVKVTNKGRERIVEAQAYIDVGEGAFSERFSSTTRSLEPGETQLLEVPARLENGGYRYEASLHYDGEVSRTTGNFVLGKPEVAYTGFFVRDFNLGTINEFVVTLENRFNRQVLADIAVELIQGSSIDRFSQQVLLEPGIERALSAYIDTTRAVEGPAVLAVEVSYDETSRVREEPVTLAQNAVLLAGQVTGSTGSNVNIVLLLVLVGVFINVGLVYALFRRKK